MTAMTCDECRQIIAVADLTDWGDMDAVATHCRSCSECSAVVTDVRDSARRVADLLDGIGPGVPAALVARRAAAEAALERQQRRRRRALLYPTVGALVAAAGIAVFVSRSGMPRYRELHLPLHCLTAEQAATLVMPVMGRDGSVVFHAEGPAVHVMTVSGPARMLAQAERVITQFDNPGSLQPGMSCLLPDGAAEAARAMEQDMLRAHEEAERAQQEVERARQEAERARQEAERARQEAFRRSR